MSITTSRLHVDKLHQVILEASDKVLSVWSWEPGESPPDCDCSCPTALYTRFKLAEKGTMRVNGELVASPNGKVGISLNTAKANLALPLLEIFPNSKIIVVKVLIYIFLCIFLPELMQP